MTSIFSSHFRYDTLPKKDVVILFIGLITGGIILNIWDLNFYIYYSSGNIFFILASLSCVAETITTSKLKEKNHFHHTVFGHSYYQH